MALPKIRCNCPDATGRSRGIPGSSTPSRMIDSSWENDFQGIGDLVPGGRCKHEIKAIIHLGLLKEFGIPTDMPNLPLEKDNKKDTSPRLQANPMYGDDFS